MPALSPSMTEGVLAKWHKKVGDTIKPGEVIAEVETDKATMDLEAFDKGTLLAIAAPEGSKVAVNGRIAVIGEPGEKVEAVSAPAPTKPAPAPATTTASSSAPVSASAPVLPPAPVASASGRVKASPLAKKIAAEKGVDLSRVAGTGPGGKNCPQGCGRHTRRRGPPRGQPLWRKADRAGCDPARFPDARSHCPPAGGEQDDRAPLLRRA